MLAFSFYHGFLAFAFFLSPALLPHHFHLVGDTLLLRKGLLEFPGNVLLFHLLFDAHLLSLLHFILEFGGFFLLFHMVFLLGQLVLAHGVS